MKCIIVGCLKDAPLGGFCDDHDTGKRSLAYQVGGNHYQNMAIQPIEYIHANKMPYMEANVVKYISRHRDKNRAEDWPRLKRLWIITTKAFPSLSS